MLDYEEEILLEQFITYNNMSKTSRDMCMHLITHLKEVCDSEFVYGKNGDKKYDVLSMNFNSDNYIITFNGIISNDTENRCIDGIISRKANNYYVRTNIYRLNEYLEDEDKDYSTFETFTVSNDSVMRKTMYKPAHGYFEEELLPFDEIDLSNYYYKRIGREDKIMIL